MALCGTLGLIIIGFSIIAVCGGALFAVCAVLYDAVMFTD